VTFSATYRATYRKEGEWWIGYVDELPGANTQGRTLDEAHQNLREAVELILATNREIARPMAARPHSQTGRLKQR
jgi:predicted RNase H-like HicB family nuclease